MKKLIATFTLAVIFAVSAVANAAPLYDYRLGHAMVTAGVWTNWIGGNDLGAHFESEKHPSLYQYANSTNNNWDVAASVGLSHNFAVRYGYRNFNGTYARTDSDNYEVKYDGNIYLQEFNLYYRLASNVKSIPQDFLNTFDSSKPQRGSEADGHNLVALFIGAVNINGQLTNTTNNWSSSNRSSWEPTIGIETSADLTPWLASTGKLSLSNNSSYYGELGLSLFFAPGASFDVQLNTLDAITDAAFMAKSGLRFGLTYQY